MLKPSLPIAVLFKIFIDSAVYSLLISNLIDFAMGKKKLF